MTGRLSGIPAIQPNYLPLLFYPPVTALRYYRRHRKKTPRKRSSWSHPLDLTEEGDGPRRSRRNRVGLLGRQSRPWSQEMNPDPARKVET